MLHNTITPIHKRLEDYRRLFEIARDLASTLDLDQLLERIVAAATDITEAEAASILLYDNTSRQLYFQAATNIEQPTMRGLVVPLEGSIAGWMVRNRKPVRISDAHQDPRHFDDVEQITHLKTQSLLGIPLIAKDKVVGVLEVINKRLREFSDTDEDLLLVLGAQAAIAIENTRLFQQSDLISEFVHELRTPLASLSTATYLLLRPEISKQQHDQIIHNIHSEAMSLNALASSFLDLARLESGRILFRFSPFNLTDLLYECKDVMQVRAQEENIRMLVDAPDNLQQLEADRDKIKQVVLNLLSNSIKYNRPEGSVTLGGRVIDGEMSISVIDTGIGIPAEAMPRLFEKFYRVRESENKADGTGLGLSICKQIVQGHGGRIEVKSKAGHGTIFDVRLPLKPKGIKYDTQKRQTLR
jgi:signal transduction histidine kinase